ncbi:hypothetical protein Ddc_18072 [Ditylenchus destructor]|nr:hypothetical protein Ddc_18072 [Ditylenchus destructor]
MLIFLTSINLGNLVFWVEWAVRMRSRKQRRAWVTKKWLNPDGFNEAELALMLRFAEGFKMGQLLYFYYIEAHTDRVVASAFCTALFGRWLERKRRQRHSIASPMDNSYMMDGPPQGGEGVPADSQMSPPGWKHLYSQTMPYPTAPFATPPYGSFMYTGDRTPTRKGHSHHSPATQTPKTSDFDNSSLSTRIWDNFRHLVLSKFRKNKHKQGAAPPLELGAQMPCTSALVGSMKARCPNMAAEVGRDSAGGRRSDRRLSRGQLARMEKHDEEEVEALTAAEPECRVTTVEQPKTQPEKKQSPPVQQRKGSGKEQKGGNQTPTKTAPPAQSGKFEQTGFGNQQSGFGNQKKVSGQENNNSKKKTPTPDPEEGEIENDAWS